MSNYDGAPLSASEMWEQAVAVLERDVMERAEIIRAQEMVIARQSFEISGKRDVINLLSEQVKFRDRRIDQLLAENEELGKLLSESRADNIELSATVEELSYWTE